MRVASLVKIVFFLFPRETVIAIGRLIKISAFPRAVRQAFEVRPRRCLEGPSALYPLGALDVEEHLREQILMAIRDIGGIHNLLELYGRSWRRVYLRFFVYHGKWYEWLSWITFTGGLRHYEAGRLARYYNSLRVSNYCGFLRLNNKEWIRHRFEQFKILRGLGIDPVGRSYVEYGGSTGLLALAASVFGFSSVFLVDICERDLRFAKDFLSKIAASASIGIHDRLPSAQNYDVISCHQVIEHCDQPEAILKELYERLSPGGLLFISTGYHVFPHPGHLFMRQAEFEQLAESVGFVKKDIQPTGDFHYLFYRQK
jgi:SAM-dependent methyltransferase